MFFCHPTKDGAAFQFFLLLSEGVHPARSEEKFARADNKRSRLQIDSGTYEAVFLPTENSSPAWTWRMTKSKMDTLKVSIEELTQRRNKRELQVLFQQIARVMGFRGIRRQKLQLLNFARGSVRRYFPSGTDFKLNLKNSWVRFSKQEMVPLDEIAARIQAGKKPFTNYRIEKGTTQSI